MISKKPDKFNNTKDKFFLNKVLQRFLPIDRCEAAMVSLKISAIYLIVGALWILLSDKFLVFLVNEKETIAFLSMLKGWMYVTVSGILIYVLVNSSFMKIIAAENNLIHSNRRLCAANEELEEAYKQLSVSQETLKQQYEQIVESQQQLKENEERRLYLAYHDQLTGLSNRLALNERMDILLKESLDKRYALLFVDIDNFKYINDTLGHTFGDLLLIQASERLVSLLESNCKVYRLGGDEFIVLVEKFKSREEIEKVAVSILKGFKVLFEVGNSSLFITVSIGVSIYPEHGVSMDELLKNADIAVYKAKDSGKNRIIIYNKPMNEAFAERMNIEKHLRTALENNEFELHYQPQLDIATNKISGLEALIRWKNFELGFISPDKFIGIAEDTHLIVPIGEWVLRNACMFLKRLHEKGYTDLNISVNISMLQLLQDDFVDMVNETIEWAKVNSKQIELEITESILMESHEAIAGKLKLLRASGIKIALDDFGKGYSSLNYLRQLPITTLKIDKTFIDTISNDAKNKSLTDLIVRIGKSMNLCVVAEGVETQVQMDYLVKHKCNRIQGYLFSKPMTEKDVLVKLIKQYE